MKVRPGVVDCEGRPMIVDVYFCDKCYGEAFRFYELPKQRHHQHIECTQCHETYCDQTCHPEVDGEPT